MKVALCLSGFASKMRETHPYLQKYVINELNADVFYHGYCDQHISKNDILETYKPVSYRIEKFDDHAVKCVMDQYKSSHPRAGGGELKNHVTKHSSAIPLLSQFYNVFKSNELKCEKEQSEDFTYDVVIRARTDYFFCRSIGPDLDLAEKYVCSTDCWDWLFGYTDAFAFGNSRDINTYSSFFNHFAEYVLDDHIPFHPETMLKHHFNTQGIERKIVPPCWWWNLNDFSNRPSEELDHPQKSNMLFPWTHCGDAIV